MLLGGLVDLNSVQFFSDSLKERLKQTMINQELMFKGQVFDLHRLYRIQIAMTEDFKKRGLDNHNFHVGGVNLVPVNNNQTKSSLVEFVESENYNKQHDSQYSTPSIQQKKPLDLQLSADEFIHRSSNGLFGRGALGGSVKLPSESKTSFPEEFAFGLDCSNHSLSTGLISSKQGSEHSSCIERRVFGSSSDIIDLEDPKSSFSNNHADLGRTCGLAAVETCFKDKHKLESFTSDNHSVENFSKGGGRNVYYGSKPSRPRFDVLQTSQRPTVRELGHDGNSGSADSLINYKRSGPCREFELDLNTPPLEDSSYISNDHSAVLNPFGSTMSTMSNKIYSESAVVFSVSRSSWRESMVSHNADTSNTQVRNDVKANVTQNFTATDGTKFSKDCKSGLDGHKPIFIDLVSDSDEELCSSKSDPKVESVGSSLKLSNGLSCEIEMVDGVCTVDKGKKPVADSYFYQNQSGAVQINCHKLSSSSEDVVMVDCQACSLNNKLSGVKGIDLNVSWSDGSEMVDMSPKAVITGEQRFSESPESKIHGTSTEPEVDATAQTAAELLVQLSLERQVIGVGSLAKFDLMKSQAKEDEQPHYSCDSYEKMVLDAKECSPDEYCISSNAFIVNETEKKDSRYKLKRGTRMKEFQKDILPSLSTLARNEVREDLNIFEGVIRSREYKKMRGKMGDGGDCSRSTRSKRSRRR